MKNRLSSLIALAALTSCSTMTSMTDGINESTYLANYSTDQVERLHVVIRENNALMDESTRLMEENLRLLEEANK